VLTFLAIHWRYTLDNTIVLNAYSKYMTANMQNKSMSLDSAPDHIKLAVDLIALLEENEIPNETAIAALEIVLSDYRNKVTNSSTPPVSE
jgi:hypothetical protein